MESVSAPCLIMASINFYVGINFLFIYLKRQKTLGYFSFSLICFSVGVYDIFCVGLYNSNSIEQGVFWQKLQLEMIVFISVFIIWFVSIFTEQKKKRMIKFYFFWYLFLFIISFFMDNKYTISPLNPAIRVEEPFEILADKITALGLRTYLKGRDIWDIYFLTVEKQISVPWNLVFKKSKSCSLNGLKYSISLSLVSGLISDCV